MALVTITGHAWDGSREPFTSAQQPRLFFRPDKSFVSAGLQAGVEVQANLNLSTGAFTVELESDPDVMWVPEMDWLVPGQESEPPERRARGHVEWPPFFAGRGGDISALMPFVGLKGVIAGFGPQLEWPTAVVYLDLADPDGIGVYGPAGALVTEGGA